MVMKPYSKTTCQILGHSWILNALIPALGLKRMKCKRCNAWTTASIQTTVLTYPSY